MAPPPLYTLPATLRTYKTQPVSNPPEPECPLCWRDYNHKENPNDPDETPCRPIQVLPCKHVFGSVCFQRLTCNGNKLCPTCRAPLKTSPDPDLDNTEGWASCDIVQRHINAVEKHIMEHSSAREFEKLIKRLFDGAMTTSEFYRLLRMYFWASFLVEIKFAQHLLASYILFLFCKILVWLCEGVFTIGDWADLLRSLDDETGLPLGMRDLLENLLQDGVRNTCIMVVGCGLFSAVLTYCMGTIAELGIRNRKQRQLKESTAMVIEVWEEYESESDA